MYTEADGSQRLLAFGAGMSGNDGLVTFWEFDEQGRWACLLACYVCAWDMNRAQVGLIVLVPIPPYYAHPACLAHGVTSCRLPMSPRFVTYAQPTASYLIKQPPELRSRGSAAAGAAMVAMHLPHTAC